jgi:hypothetical protein
MSKGKHGDNSHHHGDHRDGFSSSFNHSHDFFDFGWMSNGGHGHNGKHGHHHSHNVHIAVQGDQWVLTSGHHTQAITGNSIVLHGETYLLVDHFGGGYQTIQEAVDAAPSGATVLIADGTYEEQVTVAGSGKDGLTVAAALGCGAVVITAPATLVKTADAANTGRDIFGLVTVDGADNVTIKDVTVDGAHRGGDVTGGGTMAGIAYVDADGGVVDKVTVTGIRESDAAFGNQRGVGIYVTNTDPSPGAPNTPSAAEADALNSIEIKNSTVEDFQKGGIVVSYADVDIHDNTVVGYGLANNQAQNGIQVTNSTGSIEDNDVSDIGYATYNWGASGILTMQNRDLVIDDNTITGTGALDSVIGIYQIDSVGGRVTDNKISNVLYAIDAEDYPTAWGYPDPLLPGGGPHGSNFNYASNDVSDVYAGMWFQPDAATTDAFKVTGTSADDGIFGAAGNDNLDGGKGDDSLSGEAGDDKLDGDKGDDTLTGGADDDFIDGGHGTDTAAFAGSYDDYTITQMGKKTYVDGPDGSDLLKHVEWLEFDDARYDVAKSTVYRDDASIDVSAQDPLGQMIAGSGLSADGFGVVRNEKEGVELGLKVHKRFDSPSEISHSDTDGYADGVLHFQVDAGPGNPPANNRAEWNFDFSIATGLNGETTDLSDFTFLLKYDVDRTAATDYRVLALQPEGTPQAAGQSGFQWIDQDTNTPFIFDDEGNANVTQNSENYGFGFIYSFIDGNPATPAHDPYDFGPGTFDIALEAYDGFKLIAANHMVVDVV